MSNSIIVVIPVYMAILPKLEEFSLDYSIVVMRGRNICFLAPKDLDVSYYLKRYPEIPIEYFESFHFTSISDYNRLLLGIELYQRFLSNEFLLILQPDAIVLRDELDAWIALPFDYVGAPWPRGYELFVNLDNFSGNRGKRVNVTVGNGGFSLRRIRKTLALFAEFPEALNMFRQSGSSEDLFFSVMGSLSRDFVIPNEMTASRFSLELEPSYYVAINDGQLPMGAHAWWKYEPEFWRAQIPGIPTIL
jgi:hypothetical protein